MPVETLFTILIANYNNGKYIKNAMESVLAQTYKNIEVVVVDDGSTDHSLEILHAYAKSYPFINVYTNAKNRGCGFTKHRAASLARGGLVGFLDPDDSLMPLAIEIMVATHNDHAKASLVSSSHYVCDDQLLPQRAAYGASRIPANENYLTWGKGVTAFASYKNKYYRLTDGINPQQKRAVDQDLYYKLEEVGEVVFVPRLLYKYRIHKNGISNFQNFAKSRYWLVQAKEAAYTRRLASRSIKNITPRELRAWWSILYATKAGAALDCNKYCTTIYWMCKAIYKSPFDKYFVLKLKSLFVPFKATWFKKASK